MIKERADSLKPRTVYLSLGLINIQWRCHGWVAGIIYSQKKMFPQAATTLGANLVPHRSHLDPPFLQLCHRWVFTLTLALVQAYSTTVFTGHIVMISQHCYERSVTLKISD